MRDDVPRDREAEASLLGAMLLNRQAAETGLEACDVSDFSEEIGQRIYRAISSCYQAGTSIDTTTVLSAMDPTPGEARELRLSIGRIQAGTPASANAPHYARLVAEAASLRRAIGLADEIRTAAYDRRIETVESLLADAPGRVSPPVAWVEPSIEAAELARLEVSHDWLVEGLLERTEVAMFVGPEGGGKSLLLRQMAVQAASGIHPFTLDAVPPLRVLIVDCENTYGQVARSLDRLLAMAGDDYRGSLWVECRPQGIDLTTRRDLRWLDAKMTLHRPDLLVIGPLYKMYRGAEGRSKSGEESAEQVAATLDTLKVRHRLAVLIEAHAGHGESNSRNGWRPRGSSLWLGWPTFGFGLHVPDRPGRRTMGVGRWRGDREVARRWPTNLEQGLELQWPWIDPNVAGF